MHIILNTATDINTYTTPAALKLSVFICYICKNIAEDQTSHIANMVWMLFFCEIATIALCVAIMLLDASVA